MENQHDVTLSNAAAMTADYRTANPNQVLGGLFTKVSIDLILNQPGCEGLRYYHALNNGNRTVVLVGVDSAGNDIHQGQLAEYSLPCPATCSTANALNGGA